MKLLTVVGARPNFIKLAALHHAFQDYPSLSHIMVHTGQHYDFSMSEAFFQELAIPTPHYHLGIGSGTHAEQVGKTMIALEPILAHEQPDWTLVVGDVNATVATALTAKKLGLRLAHVEAGLRSFDWSMPEEINRVVTDRLADLLFVSDPSGIDHLRTEGVEPERIVFVGNVMIDTLFRYLPLAKNRRGYVQYHLTPGGYAVVTLHRPSNVDDPDRLKEWMDAFEEIAKEIPLLFPVHPRTQMRLKEMGWGEGRKVRLLGQLGYLDMIGLLAEARLVLTDSGGIQEETTALGVPCLTLRDNTERPITVTEGTNRVIGADPRKLLVAIRETLAKPPALRRPEKWDGKAAERIAAFLLASKDMPLRQR